MLDPEASKVLVDADGESVANGVGEGARVGRGRSVYDAWGVGAGADAELVAACRAAERTGAGGAGGLAADEASVGDPEQKVGGGGGLNHYATRIFT